MRFIPIARAPKLAAIALTLIFFVVALAGDMPFKGRASGIAIFGAGGALHTAASGRSTLLGNFTSAEDLVVSAGGVISGTFVFTAANGATLSGTTLAQFTSPTTASGTYTITGGTGRLAGASGSAAFDLVSPDGSNYTVEFSGSLSSH